MNLLNDDKSKLVQEVFNQVYNKYDLMNDIMSLGTHRIWKNNLISWIKPSKESCIIDVASGTGDIAKLCSANTKNKCKVTCVEPNDKMLSKGKNKLSHLHNINWVLSSAENLPFSDNSFDYYVISFGIRNVTNLEKTLTEAHRVLKKGGRFFSLEFSKVENEILRNIYQQYSRILPSIGKLVVGDQMPYDYLIKSIEQFYNQEDFSEKIKESGFSNVSFRNLSNGIAAIHTGWKI